PGEDRYSCGKTVNLHPFVGGVWISASGTETAQRGDSCLDEHVALVGGSGASCCPTPAGHCFGVILGKQGERMIRGDGCSRNIYNHFHFDADPRTFLLYN